jgi:hypothetical protein
VRPGGHWLPHAIPRWAVRLGAVWTGVWPRKGVVGRIGSWRIGYGHTHVWSSMHRRPTRFQWWPKIFDGMPLRATVACHDLAGGEVPLRLGDWPSYDSLWGFPGVAGSKRRALRGDGRRGEVGAGVGVATLVRRRCWRLIPVRECANACAAACARQCTLARWLPVGVGAGRDGASRRGSRWSPARRHGRR